MEELLFNKYQSSLEDLKIDSYPQEIQDQFFDFINNVPYIKWLISPTRTRAKDLPRDEEGKIIIDLTKPHIIEDTDYFRPAAIHYQKYGCFTKLRPNPNPNSEWNKWFKEECRRCYEGYVRESDGEWITGDMYFFLNYCPIAKVKILHGNVGTRVYDFPDFWEGHYLKYHYINQARQNAKHGSEMASRGKGKSFTLAAIMAKRFIFGDTKISSTKTETFCASYRKDYLIDDGVLNKFENYIDFCSENTEFPSRRKVKSSINDMQWKAGFKDLRTGTTKGTQNEVIGVSVKDSEGKLRGKRGAFIGLEEMGSFPNLIGLYGTLRPSMEDGNIVFGMIYAQGTSGDKDSDFSAAQSIMYSPEAFNMQPIQNVYDKEGTGRKHFVYFFPAYMNRNGCYNVDGVSDVTKAILEVLINRYNVKYNSTDTNLITKTIAEHPIVPQEAILRTRGNVFPTTELNARLNQLDSNPAEFNDVYIGSLVFTKGEEVDFVPTTDLPIREFPHKDNKLTGAIEIFKMPEKDANGKVFSNRYIIGHDPVDDDEAETASLTSTFVLDTWLDIIVAEYTGRHSLAEENFEIVRKLCLFYNAKCLYEANKKGIFAYFQKMHCLHRLADTPEYLRDRDIIKAIGQNNKSKGVSATAPVNNYANRLIRDWLLKPVPTIEIVDGQEVETTTFNLYKIRNRALLKELTLFNPEGNFDRIRALGMLMLYREEKMIAYGGDPQKQQEAPKNYLGNDAFFSNNYDNRFKQY